MSLTLTESYGADIANGTFLTIPDDDAWHEIIASAVGGNYLQLQYLFDTDFDLSEISIGIGPSGSEIAIVDRFEGTLFSPITYLLSLPIQVPTGSRICLKASASKSAIDPVQIYFSSYIDTVSSTSYSALDLLGSASLVTVDAVGTKTGWVEITPATTQDYKAIVFNNFHFVEEHFAVMDIATGPSGSETIIVNDAFSSGDDRSRYLFPTEYSHFGVSIPSGTRLSCRIGANSAGQNNRIKVWGLR